MVSTVIHYPTRRDENILKKLRSSILSQVSLLALYRQFPLIVRDAISFVADPVHTGRTTVDALDNVEKTFISLKCEHYIRHLLRVPKGRRDLCIGQMDVDVKGTVGRTWMIPKETYDEEGMCLLVKINDAVRRCSLGLLVARDDYLNAANRDLKRSISADAPILWLIDRISYPRVEGVY